MGNNACSCNGQQQKNGFRENIWEYEFNEDMNTGNITHNDTIRCKDSAIETNVHSCQQKLQQSKRLYKDPTVQTKPIVLVGKDKTQINCTYQRPSALVEDKESKSKHLFQLVDLHNSKISQIVINNHGLQYFGMFLCFLAQFPELIETIILTEANTYGLHVVKAQINGKKEYIYIDDYILCEGKTPLFSQVVNKKYIWPCIIEKSWLKIHGNITNKIQYTLPEEIFSTYLSIPTKTYILSDDHQHNKGLIEQHINGKSKHARCIITTKVEPIHKIGISGRKQYYLIEHFQGEHQKWYYHFRNVCKVNNFRGCHTLQAFQGNIRYDKGQSQEDSTFILDEQEFIEQVEQFFIVYHEKQTKHSTKHEIDIKQNQQFYAKVHVSYNEHISIAYNQSSYNKQYNPIIYHVVSLSDNKCISDLDDPEGCFGVKNTCSCVFYEDLFNNIYAHVYHGAYLIRIKKKMAKNGNVMGKFNKNYLIVNSMHKVTIEDAKSDSAKQQQYKESFHTFLRHKGQSLLSIQKQKGAKIEIDIRYSSFWLGNLAVVYVVKINKQKEEVKLQVNFSQIKNLECLSHPHLKNEYTSLKPFKENLLIIFEKIDSAEETIFGKYTIESY